MIVVTSLGLSVLIFLTGSKGSNRRVGGGLEDAD
jgi:hypothetical protein